jgi:hypothetical protein
MLHAHVVQRRSLQFRQAGPLRYPEGSRQRRLGLAVSARALVKHADAVQAMSLRFAIMIPDGKPFGSPQPELSLVDRTVVAQETACDVGMPRARRHGERGGFREEQGCARRVLPERPFSDREAGVCDALRIRLVTIADVAGDDGERRPYLHVVVAGRQDAFFPFAERRLFMEHAGLLGVACPVEDQPVAAHGGEGVGGRHLRGDHRFLQFRAGDGEGAGELEWGIGERGFAEATISFHATLGTVITGPQAERCRRRWRKL